MDLQTLFGTGAGAALAALIERGAKALNKDASPHAKRDIADFVLNYERRIDLTLVTRHLPQIFEAIYGRRHFGVRCILMSIATTAIVIVFAFSAFFMRFGEWPGFWDRTDDLDREPWHVKAIAVGTTIMTVVVIDYAALWKSRALLSWSCKTRHSVLALLAPLVDVVVSSILLLLGIALVLFLFPLFKYGSIFLKIPYLWLVATGEELRGIISEVRHGTLQIVGSEEPLTSSATAPILLISTFMTAVWALSVSVSAIILRGILVLRFPIRLLRYLYDPKENSIYIVGLMLTALAWTFWTAFILL